MVSGCRAQPPAVCLCPCQLWTRGELLARGHTHPLLGSWVQQHPFLERLQRGPPAGSLPRGELLCLSQSAWSWLWSCYSCAAKHSVVQLGMVLVLGAELPLALWSNSLSSVG